MAFPLRPPASWFVQPEPDHAEPLTVEADGRVHGHLAPWDGCHAGMINGTAASCVRPPRSRTEYRMFHLGALELDDGSAIPVGKVVIGPEARHADLALGLQAATAHYDRTGAVGAFVRARDGAHGIWLSGVLRSDISPEQLRDLRANLPSGDWRVLDRNLELVGALAVPVPGYGVPALVASAEGKVEALIFQGFTSEEEPMAMNRGRAYLRKRKTIQKSLVAAALTTKRRNLLPRRDFAVPETRSYPINDEAHARNALARSSGKPEEARVRRAVCRRYPDMGECKS